jgi:hypothetical protein
MRTKFPLRGVKYVLGVEWDKWAEERTEDDVCVREENVREDFERPLARSRFAVENQGEDE